MRSSKDRAMTEDVMGEARWQPRRPLQRVGLFALAVLIPVTLGYLVVGWDWLMTVYETVRMGGFGPE